MSENHRKLAPGELIIASHNDGKVREINDLLKPYSMTAISAKKIGLPEPEETGKTFAANAGLKARAAAQAANLPALADDSGLCVHALDNAPGIYSARWAGDPRDFGHAMKRVETELAERNAKDYSAHFVCALALAWPDGHEEIFEGTVHGTLVFPGRGEKGFGYDPIFMPDGYETTFGEMDPDAKHAMSHRAEAFRKLIKESF
ncbi:RdgB/HAM1 family non-canonical purine NTP pyrophosphatase [Hyphococcus sp. DH-69]|uniref:RdgB/HAM1 family non-canonical purine NTP pyrophosphatase n=1 Tax=Hyphococcus formosus TaxID=3143534 RepID=UPI00398BAB9A